MADSLLDAVSDAAEKIGIEPKNIEGKPASGWVLADYGDIIVNVFLAEQRATYRLEKIWSDGEFIEIE
jgi:ribosome-associated protein